jgi:hypothetical protein
MTQPRITPEELTSALFVDYEGNMQRDPTLLGWRVDGITHGAIVDPDFAPCAHRWRAKKIFLHSHRALVRELITQVSDERRVVIGWSEHDLKLMQALLPPKEQDRLTLLYRNAVKTARSWHARHENRRAPTGELAYFCQLLGFPVPQAYGAGRVGQALRLIRGQLLEGRDYPDLTRRARASWAVVVKHNALDLQAMEFVLHAMLGVALHKRQPAQMALTLVQSD